MSPNLSALPPPLADCPERTSMRSERSVPLVQYSHQIDNMPACRPDESAYSTRILRGGFGTDDENLTLTSLFGGGRFGQGQLPHKETRIVFGTCPVSSARLVRLPKNHCPCIFEGHFSTNLRAGSHYGCPSREAMRLSGQTLLALSIGQRLCINFYVSRANFLTTLCSHLDII
jgi:hypothetical protein